MLYPQQRGRHALVLFVFTMNAGVSCIGACHHYSNISVFWSLMRAARYLQSHTCLPLSLQICYCVTSSSVDHKYLNIFTVYTFRANMWRTASRLLSSGIKVSRTITSDPISLIKTITITANFQTQSFAAPQLQPDHHLYSNSVTFPPLAAADTISPPLITIEHCFAEPGPGTSLCH